MGDDTCFAGNTRIGVRDWLGDGMFVKWLNNE